MELADRLAAWGVAPAGPVRRTASSELVDGSRDGRAVVLKRALVAEEIRGGALLAWWRRGAVEVLEQDGDAVLMARADGPRDLVRLSRSGDDGTVVAAMLGVADLLHRPIAEAAGVDLVPLEAWFRDLTGAGPPGDPLLDAAASIARELLDRDRAGDVVLHGDLHHGNVLDAGGAWVAIDPKALRGPAAFDVGNLFCNPDAATAIAHLDDRLAHVARHTGLPVRGVARWVVAWCGLSTVWHGLDGDWHAGACRLVGERLLPVAR